MYQKGMVTWETAMDSSDEGAYRDIEGACLPHRCQDWVIGDKERIRWLIEDLQDLLARAK